MSYFRNHGCQLHYEEYGFGTPVVLLHGLGFSTLDWENHKAACVAELRDARLVVIEHSRHASPIDQPHRFNATLLEFPDNLPTKEQ